MVINIKETTVAFFLIFSLQMLTCIALHSESFASSSSNPKDSGNWRIQEKNGADPQGNLYRMPSSEFFRKRTVEEKIDLKHINYNLLSAAIFHETNQKRKKYGKEPLSHLPRLDEASMIHAGDMAEHQYVGHMNPRERELRTPLDRVQEVGLDDIHFVAENVASHFGLQYKPGTAVFQIKKDGHTEYSYQPGGKPIENHTYRSFAESLVMHG